MFSARDLRPMLAVLGEPPLTGAGLVYEPKYDGIRAIVLIEPAEPGPRVQLWSRQGNDKTGQFPDVAGGLAAWAADLPGPLVLDGELVALDADGQPAGFQQLQQRMHVKAPGYQSPAPTRTPAGQPAAFIAFDLLRHDDHDLRARPLRERRQALEALFGVSPPSPTVRLAPQVAEDGRALYAQAEAEGWEGLIVKHARSPYRAGTRSAEWRKLKLLQEGTFIIGGWTEPKGSRVRFGALILGVRDEGALRYVGDVGTGFTDAEIDRVWRALDERRTAGCPFDTPPKTRERAHWVTPDLAASVRFTEMTNEGRLRHPVYMHIRNAEGAGDATAPETKAGPRKSATKAGTTSRGTMRADAGAALGVEARALIAQIDDLESRRKNGRLTLPDGGTLDVTNLHKVFWPAAGRTKGDLLRHYVRVAPYILPVVADRPLVMKRLPNGVTGQAFYQHRAPEPVPDGIRIETLPDDDVPARLVGGSLKTLLYMAQLASISMDPWFSTMDALDHPDQVAIDLDPQPGCTFERLLDVARSVHEALARAGVEAYPKTSGSEGLHIFIPLPPGTPYEAGMLFCQIVATLVATRHPKAATVERTVRRRKAGTVYVDYLQNIQGKTLACAYSARASPFAGVSAPLRWEELDAGIRPQDFTIDTMPARLAAVGDLWAGVRASAGADLIHAIERLR
ncbi:MAG: DNA ligase D [Vicinamibacterales bacterium]|nr:DNA ligase D [Vicinamibacterales bacterium]